MELYAYAQSLADDRRARPMDDIVTTLITAELDGEKLSDIEFNVFVLLLSVAGNETTRNLISGGMLALMENPEQQERLAGDLDGLMPTARRRDAPLRQPGAVLPAHRDRRHRAPRRADRRRATRSRSGTAPRTATRRSSTDPQSFDVGAHARTSTSRSVGAARTSASARAWRRWRSG